MIAQDGETDYQRLKRLFNAVCELPDEATQRAQLLVLQATADDVVRVLALLAPGRDTGFSRPVAGMLASAVASELQPGDRLGPWRLSAEIGAGGMGRVFAAERDDGQYRQRAAVKVLLGWAGADGLERLARERQILATLAHPHIARLLDGGSTPLGRPYLVMEYIDGVPIDAWCRQQPRGVEAVLDQMVMLCDAVGAAHRQLIVHCDLKPSNVLVTADGRAMLLDFGIAQLQAADPGAVPHPAEEGVALTPRYASPEQKAGLPATMASDIHGLGRLFDELMRLALAPRADGGVTLPPREAEWSAIVARATAERPERRYPTVQALADDLQRFRRHQPLQALPPVPLYLLRKGLRRHWPWAVAGSLALAGALSFTLRLMVERDRARSAEQRALQEAATTRQVSDFVVDLFKGADPRQAGRPDLPANVLVERGRDKVATSLQGQPALQAALKMVLGEAFENMGRAREAVALYREAAALENSSAVGQPLRAAAALSRLAVQLSNDYQASAAEAPARQSLAIRQARLPADSLEVADSLNSLGIVLMNLGKTDEAQRCLQQALEVRRLRSGADSLDVASTLHNLGLVELRRERPDLAETHYRRALAIKQARLPPNHLSVLNTRTTLATALALQQKLQEAERLQRELVDARRRLHGERSLQLSGVLALLAQTLHDAGRLDEALATLQQAVAASPDGEQSLAGAALAVIQGPMQADAGLDAQAEQSLQRARVLRVARFGEGDLPAARALASLGRLWLHQQRDGAAGPALIDALQQLVARLPPQHSDLAALRLDLAELALRRRQSAAATTLLQEAAEHEATAPRQRRPQFERVRALLAEQAGDRAAAQRHWQQALALAERDLAPTHRVRLAAALDQVDALRRGGELAAARSLLAAQQPALRGYGPQSPFVKRAAQLAAQLRDVTA